MFRLQVETHFDAAHFIPGYKGPCGTLHGHRWLARAYWVFDKLDKLGIAADFRKLKTALEIATEDWDHANLNEVLAETPPTAEHLAVILYKRLSIRTKGLDRVEIEETPGCIVAYKERA